MLLHLMNTTHVTLLNLNALKFHTEHLVCISIDVPINN